MSDPSGAVQVDIGDAVQAARADARSCPPGDPYGEVMATYAELGELLESGGVDEDYVVECRDLVSRLIGLGRAVERQVAVQLQMLRAGGAR